MNEDDVVDLPASDVRVAVAQVLEDTSPFAHEAALVAEVVVGLRDAGLLSGSTSDSITSLIYQRQMHSGHTGDFRVTGPIQELKRELDRFPADSLPRDQADPVGVPSRVVDIVAGIAVPDPRADARTHGDQGVGADDAARVEPVLRSDVRLARLVHDSVPPGWDSLRYEVHCVGNVTEYIIHAQRGEKEERHFPPLDVIDLLTDLKHGLDRPGTGTWLSMTMTLQATGQMDIEYNYDDLPAFDFELPDHEYRIELQRHTRDPDAIPGWWAAKLGRSGEAQYVQPDRGERNAAEAARLEQEIVAVVRGGLPAGWDAVRVDAGYLGGYVICRVLWDQDGHEHEVATPEEVFELLKFLKIARYTEDTGTWLSMRMLLQPTGPGTITYTYDEEPNLGFDVPDEQFLLELQRFPRYSDSVPAWWNRRLAAS